MAIIAQVRLLNATVRRGLFDDVVSICSFRYVVYLIYTLMVVISKSPLFQGSFCVCHRWFGYPQGDEYDTTDDGDSETNDELPAADGLAGELEH